VREKEEREANNSVISVSALKSDKEERGDRKWNY
jgi:hypothetical protein